MCLHNYYHSSTLLQLDALRPFDDLRQDRRGLPVCVCGGGLVHCILKKEIGIGGSSRKFLEGGWPVEGVDCRAPDKTTMSVQGYH